MALARIESEARGSMCIVDGTFAEVSPPIGSVVPRNARIRVRLTMAPRGKAPPGRIHLSGPLWSGPIEAVTVSLRAVGARAGDDGAVAADVTSFGMEQERIVELVPREPLARGRHFEIVLALPSGQTRRLGGFTASSASDSTPPVWKGLTRARIAAQRPPLASGTDAGVVVVESSADRGRPWLVVEAPAATDAATPATAIVYGVWVAPATGGPIDYARPPVSYVARRNGVILVGRDTAYPENDLCDLPLLPLPPEATAWRVGLRAVDWAGNASAASEIILNAGAPVPPPQKTPTP